MTTMQLECFLAVTETLNFAKAASQLNVTQPAVTQQIRTLEEELNIKLFKRTTRMVQLTPEGQIFFDDARDILNKIRFTIKKFQEHAGGNQVLFSIGCHSHDDLVLLTDILRDMAKHYPSLRPIFHAVPFQHLYRLLAEEVVDVIMAFREKDAKISYGTYQEFIKTPIVAALPEGHPLAGKSHLTLEDIADERVILNPLHKSPGSLKDIQHALVKNRSITECLFCDTPQSGLLLAKAGYGITVLPELFIRNASGLFCVPLVGTQPLSYGVYYKSTAGNPLLKLFLKLCKTYLTANQMGL